MIIYNKKNIVLNKPFNKYLKESVNEDYYEGFETFIKIHKGSPIFKRDYVIEIFFKFTNDLSDKNYNTLLDYIKTEADYNMAGSIKNDSITIVIIESLDKINGNYEYFSDIEIRAYDSKNTDVVILKSSDDIPKAKPQFIEPFYENVTEKDVKLKPNSLDIAIDLLVERLHRFGKKNR